MNVRRPTSPAPKRILCLGEALVDLICERPVADLAAAVSFVPHFGGTVANVAAVAAAAGAPVSLAGGAGADSWGEWLRARLVRERVDVSLFELVPDSQTLLALVRIDELGEPEYRIYGDAADTVLRALGSSVDEAVDESAALLISSNTLVSDPERAVTMQAREVALERGRPVIFEANLRLHRWRSRADAAASANACVPGALLVRASVDEATLMTGEEDPEAAAGALVKGGASLVVLTLGARGAMVRGQLRADVPGVAVKVVSTLGAGDVLTGVLLARLARSGFYPPSVPAALPEAVTRAAQACLRWGALD